MSAPLGNKFAAGFSHGRPPMYETPEAMQNAIADYFANGIKIRKILIGKPPKQQEVEIQVPTITGLVLHLGFESRQSFYDYEQKEEFAYTVKKARTFIEQHYEEILQTGNPVAAIFALKQFGWKDKVETEHTGNMPLTVLLQRKGEDYKPVTDDELIPPNQ